MLNCVKHLLIVLTLALALLATVCTAVSHAGPRYTGIGITGTTKWPAELQEAIELMSSYGVPTTDGCWSGQLCVQVSHYSKRDGTAGLAIMGDHPEIRLNDYYDAGHWHRMQLLLHEMGHQAGLGHSRSCDSSMYPSVPACGYYVVGISAAERASLRERWS